VCVCVRERDKERVCVCVLERERECVSVLERERVLHQADHAEEEQDHGEDDHQIGLNFF